MDESAETAEVNIITEDQPLKESQNLESARLVKIDCNKADLHTEQEKAEGMPWLINEGMLAIELDTQAIANLLKQEGLTPKQSSSIKLTFAAARITDVDGVGDPIGGIHRETEAVVYTSIPFNLHPEPTPPPITKNRFVLYQSAVPPSEVIDVTLHELKHCIQYLQGIPIQNSWAAESIEDHDQLPAEKEAIEFATKHAPEFSDKFKVYDDSGHFRPAKEVIPQSEQGLYATGLVNEQMVAKFVDTSVGVNLAYEYIDKYEKLIQQAQISHSQILGFADEGEGLVIENALSEYEVSFMLDKLRTRLT